jgi:hypothetical protein
VGTRKKNRRKVVSTHIKRNKNKKKNKRRERNRKRKRKNTKRKKNPHQATLVFPAPVGAQTSKFSGERKATSLQIDCIRFK